MKAYSCIRVGDVEDGVMEYGEVPDPRPANNQVQQDVVQNVNLNYNLRKLPHLIRFQIYELLRYAWTCAPAHKFLSNVLR
jgi:hypothetical protein